MKKTMIKFAAVITALLMVTSCEWEAPMFDTADSFIAYTSSSSSVGEAAGTLEIPVLVTAMTGASSVDVTFSFDESSTAVEGEAFTLVEPANKTLTVADGYGYAYITIAPIDNDIFTGNLDVIINLDANTQDYPFGVTSSHTATIIDDEHPLGTWIGSYSVAATDYVSYFGPETWAVTTAPDPSDVNNLVINGIGTGFSEFTSITGVVDLEAMTITLSSGAEIGTHADYGGPLAIYSSDVNGTLGEDPIVGTISEDGSIVIDPIGILFVGGLNDGLRWGAYATTWTKTGKKSAPALAQPAARTIKLEQ